MAEEIDRIRIVVEPDSSGFKQDLETDLAKIKVDVNVPVDVDTKAAKVTIEKFRTGQEDPIDIPITADTKLATAETKKFTAKTESEKVDIPVDANTTAATTAVAGFKKKTEVPTEVPVLADTLPALASVKRLTERITIPKIMPIVVTALGGSLKKFESLTRGAILRTAAFARTAFTGVAFGTLAVGIGVVASALRSGVKSTLALSQVTGQLNNAYSNLGINAGDATKKSLELASSISESTGISSIAIANAEKVLVSLGGVAPKSLDRVTRAVVDLSAASANGVEPGVRLASVQVAFAKALARPEKAAGVLRKAQVNLNTETEAYIKTLIKGEKPVLALQRAGVKLSDAQFDAINKLKPGQDVTEALTKANINLTKAQSKTFTKWVAGGRVVEAQNEILKAAEKSAKDAGKVYGESLPGQIARSEHVFSRFSRKLALGVLNTALPVLLANAEKIGAVLDVLGPKIGVALGKGVQGAIKGFLALSDAISRNMPQIKDIAAGVVTVLAGSLAVLKQLGLATIDIFKDIVGSFSDGKGEALTFGGALKKVGAGLQKFATFLKNNQKVTKAIAVALIALVAGFEIAPIVAGITALVGAIAAVGPEVALVIAAVVALGVAFAAAFTKSKGFRDFILSLVPIMRQTFAVMAQVFKIFVDTSTVFLNSLIASISGIIKGFKLVFKGGFTNIVRGVILIVSNFVRLIVTILGRIPRFALAIIKKFGPAMLAFWGSLFQKTTELAIQFGIGLVKFFVALPGRIIAAIIKLVPLLPGVARRAISAFASAISAGANRVITFMKRMPGRIAAALGPAATALASKGRQFLDGLLAGLKEKFEDVKNFVKKIAGIIKSLKGPIEVDRKLLVPEGKAIMSGFEKGIESRWKPIAKRLAGIAGDIAITFGSDPLGAGLAAGVAAIGGGLGTSDVAALNEEIGSILAGEKQPAGGGGGFDAIFKIFEKLGLAGLHPSSGLADTMAQERIMHKVLGIVGTTFKAGHSKYVAGRPGVISDHWTGRAVDFGDQTAGNDHANLDRAARILQKYLGKALKQIIWHGGRYSSGPAGGHKDHMHVGWLAKRSMGGRVGAGTMYEVNEGGRREAFVPDYSGFILSHAKLNKLLKLQDRVKAIETASSNPVAIAAGAAGKQTTQHNQIDIKMEHNVPDAGSLAAILNTRLDVAMRNFAMPGGVA